MTIPAAHLFPLGCCFAAAAYFDISKRRIPNAVTAATALLGLGIQWWDNGFLAALSGLGAGALTVAVLYRVWAGGGIGGGDVKLAAAVAIWVGLGKIVGYALATAVAGGIVAAICYLLSKATARKEIRDNLVNAAVTQALPQVPPRSEASRSGASTDAPPEVLPTASPWAAGRVSVPYGIAVIVGGAVALWGHWGL